MPTTLTVGRSAASDPAAAAAEAVRGALRGADHPIAALVLSTDQYDHDALARAVSAELGVLPWGGCCTAGVLAGGTLLRQGIGVGILSSWELLVGFGMGGPVSTGGRRAGRDAVATALAQLPPYRPDRHRALVLLPDALTGNAADVVRGAAEEAGSGITWAGGGAGDNLRFVRTAQYVRGAAHHDHVVAIAIDAPRRLGAGIRHGWRPYGPPTMVTRAEGAKALELDYEKAFDVYRRTVEQRGDRVTLEKFAAFAMTHPLGIPQADGEHVIRDPLAVAEDGGLVCVAEVPDGTLVRIMEGDRDALLSAAGLAATAAREATDGPLAGAFAFDCVSRSLLLKEDVGQEFAAFQRGLGEEVPLLGCLTFGEVGALGTGVPQFHNKTAVILAIPE